MSNSPRRICVVTGTRAEYGLLYWLMKSIAEDSALQLQVAVTGAHLSPEFGLTWREIEADGFRIDARVEMLLSADSATAVTKSIGVATMGFADAFARLAPDVVVVLGDRYEILAAAQAALIARIPIAHIHGGETSEGAYDESIRHAVTKMAQLHFTAAEPYRQRVIQMGEDPARVFNFGAPGLDHLSATPLMTRDELAASLGFPLGRPLLLVTYHPVTLSDAPATVPMQELLAALRQFPEAQMVLTYPNADSGGRALIPLIDQFAAEVPQKRHAFKALGHRRYLSLMNEADAVVGNSSSGLTEAPALKRATVNIGDRQKGRLKASSVIDAPEKAGPIAEAIRKALSPQFRDALPQTVSVYGHGDASRRIRDVLRQAPLEVRKSFFDIRF
jgi:UDP-hydrolysing UDP-N-acetyl-D-glucosamine 2-epimerase